MHQGAQRLLGSPVGKHCTNPYYSGFIVVNVALCSLEDNLLSVCPSTHKTIIIHNYFIIPHPGFADDYVYIFLLTPI